MTVKAVILPPVKSKRFPNRIVNVSVQQPPPQSTAAPRSGKGMNPDWLHCPLQVAPLVDFRRSSDYRIEHSRWNHFGRQREIVAC